MTETEAVEFVQKLVHTYPGAKFTEQNARIYQGLVAALDRSEAETARIELAETSKFIPSFAEIREAVMRNRRHRSATIVARPLRPPDGGNAPTPAEWGACLAKLLEGAERHRRMVQAWPGWRGKSAPADPAQPFIDLAQAGASGEDVRHRFRRQVLGDQDEQERRYP